MGVRENVIEKLVDKIKSLEFDLTTLHIPRVKEGLSKHYYDENQALVVYDHLIKLRIYNEVLQELR